MSKIYLIGAGPGDPGLLTLKAKEILETADVVIYDYLANQAFLKFCKPASELIYVGKRGGSHTLSQDKINQLLLEKAKQNLVVARLKGGDPYIFGRGGEEAQELAKVGIDFEVIPGITSAIAAPSYAGIPLTHREYSSSVCFITGHEDPGKESSSHNWSALANSGSTLVFLMGVKNLALISEKLIQAGLDKNVPASLIRWGSTCHQESMTANIGNIAKRSEEKSLKPPAILVVGQVVKLKDQLGWFEKKPLFGQGVVVTRAREQASKLVDLLHNQGACCFEFPTISIEPLPDYSQLKKTISSIHEYDWVIFTSVNGVKFFWNQLEAMNKDTRTLGNCQVGAIGPATADLLRTKGVHPDFVPKDYVAESIVEGLLEKGVLDQKVLIPRAEKAREILPQKLSQAGAKVEVIPVYQTKLTQQDGLEIIQAMQDKKVQYITFTSSSTVRNFFQLVSQDSLRDFVPDQVSLACIGPVTAKTLEEYGFKADIIPEKYTISALTESLIQDGQRKRG